MNTFVEYYEGLDDSVQFEIVQAINEDILYPKYSRYYWDGIEHFRTIILKELPKELYGCKYAVMHKLLTYKFIDDEEQLLNKFYKDIQNEINSDDIYEYCLDFIDEDYDGNVTYVEHYITLYNKK